MNKFKENCEAHSNEKFSAMTFDLSDTQLHSNIFCYDVVTKKAYKDWMIKLNSYQEQVYYNISNNVPEVREFHRNLTYKYGDKK